jgi:hypothetical protein
MLNPGAAILPPGATTLKKKLKLLKFSLLHNPFQFVLKVVQI